MDRNEYALLEKATKALESIAESLRSIVKTIDKTKDSNGRPSINAVTYSQF